MEHFSFLPPDASRDRVRHPTRSFASLLSVSRDSPRVVVGRPQRVQDLLTRRGTVMGKPRVHRPVLVGAGIVFAFALSVAVPRAVAGPAPGGHTLSQKALKPSTALAPL